MEMHPSPTQTSARGNSRPAPLQTPDNVNEDTRCATRWPGTRPAPHARGTLLGERSALHQRSLASVGARPADAPIGGGCTHSLRPRRHASYSPSRRGAWRVRAERCAHRPIEPRGLRARREGAHGRVEHGERAGEGGEHTCGHDDTAVVIEAQLVEAVYHPYDPGDAQETDGGLQQHEDDAQAEHGKEPLPVRAPLPRELYRRVEDDDEKGEDRGHEAALDDGRHVCAWHCRVA
eukprot:scaffold74023_cov75-Phaeocystis_antarctica.AAC.3